MIEKIIIFNGPPMSGKDLFADLLRSYILKVSINKDLLLYPTRPTFKSSLVDFTKKYYIIDDNEWDKRYDNRKLKETPWDKLNGLSQREALIDMSENKIKPTLGKDFFGKAMVINLKNTESQGSKIKDYPIISDGGFKEELQPLIDEFGADKIVVFRLHREGYDFSGDSRGYIQDDWFPDIRIYDIESGDHDETLKEIVNYLFA